MNMAEYLLAHDLGTSGDKATLFRTDGKLVKSVIYEYPTHFFNSTWAEQDPEDWWKAVCANNHELLKDLGDAKVAGMAFSGQMMGCVVVDRQGKALRDAIIWADQRSREQEAFIREKMDEQEFYRITGHRISASYSIEKLMWIRDNEPEIFRNIYKMLQPKDYIVAKLTGEYVTDFSDASGTNCLNLKDLEWSDPLLEMMKIDRSLLPELKPSTYVAGEIIPGISGECGLPVGTPVILGGGDGLCAAVGAGSVKKGVTYNYLGSSSWVAFTSDRPVFDREMRTYNWAHMVPGLYTPNGTMQAAGNSYHFVKETLCKDLDITAAAQKVSPYELMNREIEKSPLGANGLLYLPYILGERSPRWNSEAKGAYIGLKMEHTRGDMLRACIEGIVMNLNIILEIFRAEQRVDQISILGGLAKGNVICQILADIYGLPVCRLNYLDEATSMGAAVAAGVGAGALEGFEAIDRFVEINDCVEPDLRRHQEYQELQKLFNESYEALLPVYHRLAGSGFHC